MVFFVLIWLFIVLKLFFVLNLLFIVLKLFFKLNLPFIVLKLFFKLNLLFIVLKLFFMLNLLFIVLKLFFVLNLIGVLCVQFAVLRVKCVVLVALLVLPSILQLFFLFFSFCYLCCSSCFCCSYFLTILILSRLRGSPFLAVWFRLETRYWLHISGAYLPVRVLAVNISRRSILNSMYLRRHRCYRQTAMFWLTRRNRSKDVSKKQKQNRNIKNK